MRPILLFGLTSVAAACGNNSMMSDGDDTPVNCATETRAEPFVVGVDKAAAGGMFDFKMIDATPAAPAKNDNTWTIQVNAMANAVVGAPVTGANIVVTPYMPDHMHGNGIPVDVAPMPDAGQYKFDPLFLGMAGYWEITVDVTAASTHDSVIYKICIPN
jgi:hypothetical protein